MNITIEEAFEQFIQQKVNKLSRRNYQHRLQVFIRDNGTKPLTNVTRTDVNEWWDIMTSLGHATATESGYKQAMKSFWNFVIKRKWLHPEDNPSDHLTVGSFQSEQQKLPSEVDVQTIVTMAMAWSTSSSASKRRVGAITLLSYESGARRGELLNLKLTEIENALHRGPYGKIYKATTAGKTRQKKMSTIRFSHVSAIALRQWLEMRPTAGNHVSQIFCTTKKTKTPNDTKARYRPLSISRLRHDLDAIANACGVRPIHTHAFRHRKGTLTVQMYDPRIAQELLNHTQLKTTLEMYYHPDEKTVNDAVAETSPPPKTEPNTALDPLVAAFFKQP